MLSAFEREEACLLSHTIADLAGGIVAFLQKRRLETCFQHCVLIMSNPGFPLLPLRLVMSCWPWPGFQPGPPHMGRGPLPASNFTAWYRVRNITAKVDLRLIPGSLRRKVSPCAACALTEEGQPATKEGRKKRVRGLDQLAKLLGDFQKYLGDVSDRKRQCDKATALLQVS